LGPVTAGLSPILGVSALIAKERRVVLVKRARGVYAGLWSLPGGRVELGETLREAARREVREETGLSAEIGRLVTAVDIIESETDGAPVHHFVVVVFLGEEAGGTLRAGGDAAEARRFGLDELTGLAITPGTADLIAEALQTYG
jgi:8-oxo-dGTP diphosphatase